MSTPPLRVRLGELYQAQLDQASTNTSAALRAFLLLGFAAAGVDMRPLQREVRRALAEDLPAAVVKALRLLLDGSDRPGMLDQIIFPSAAPPAEVQELDGADPLLSVGHDF